LKGILHELTVAHSPEQNGVAERMNRTLVESARAMLSHAGLRNNLWAEAINTAAYLRNRIPTAAVKEMTTPYERWYGRKPSISHLRVFGCVAYAHIPDVERRKLDKKARKLRFVGYSMTSKGYRLFDGETHKVITRRDVVFNETEFGQREVKVEPDPVNPNSSVSNIDSGDSDPVTEEETKPSTEPRRSERVRRPPVRFGYDEHADTATPELEVDHFLYHVSQIVEPATLSEALDSKYAGEWKKATDSEYDSLMENETWKLVELP